MAYAMTWLADVLRAAGCKVIEQPGWKDRGRGDMGTVKGVLAHHTGAGSTKGLLSLIVEGRKDLPGPLSQLFLDEDGTWHVIAAGRCNHAGEGNWHGVTAGNSSFIGVEAHNAGDGKDVWEGGKILDPENGRNYTLRLTPIEGGKKLEVRGSIGPFGRTQTWIRVQ